MTHSISASVTLSLGENQARYTASYAAYLKIKTKQMDTDLNLNPTK